MEKILNQYEKLFKKLKFEETKTGKDYNSETGHMLQDQLYRKFIKDICNGNLNNIDDIKLLANAMKNNVVKYDKNRWYS